MAGVQAELTKILNDYSKEVEDVTVEAAGKAARATVRMIKGSAPSRRGKYKRGWRCKRNDAGMLKGYVVYNGRLPGLTHLLEHGHVSRNQYGEYGRVSARPHIKAAEQEGIRIFEQEIRDKLGG